MTIIGGFDGTTLSSHGPQSCCSPSLAYLAALTSEDERVIINRMGSWLPIQVRRDAYESVWYRAYVRGKALGIETQDHALAHPYPDRWLVRAGRNEARRALAQVGKVAALGDDMEVAGPISSVLAELSEDEDRDNCRAAVDRMHQYCDDLPAQDLAVFLAARKPIETLLQELPTGVSHPLNLLRLDRIPGRSRRLSDERIAAILHHRGVREQHLEGYDWIRRAILESRPPSPEPLEVTFAEFAWRTICSLPDPWGRALALHVFGTVALEIDASPLEEAVILGRCELTFQKDETVRWMAVGVTARPDAVISVEEVGKWAHHRDREVRAQLRQCLLNDGFGPEALSVLHP